MRSYRNKKTLIIRIVSLIIAALMVIGVLISAILSVHGVDEIPPSYSLYTDEDVMLRLGVYYAEDTLTSYRLRGSSSSGEGYDLYKTNDKEYDRIWRIEQSTVYVCIDGNLKYKNDEDGYRYYFRTSSPSVGGYHVLLDGIYSTEEETKAALLAFYEKSSEYTLIPSYENGEYKIKAGQYSSLEAANEASVGLSECYGVQCTGVGYTETSIVILSDKSEILFLFDCGNEGGLGVYALGEENYVKLDTGYYRSGINEFKRYTNESESADGLSLIIICSLEEYTMGVVPWEIYNHWHTEIVKAFAITARSYAYANIGKHKKHGFDICASSHCQNNKGMGRVNQNVRDSVLATKDKVLICEGKIVDAYCNDLGGGSIAAGHQVWNQDELPYLQGMFTPWEILEGRTYGHWEFKTSASELCSYLNTRGYTTLKDEIADIKITLCDNSSYVYRVTITDIHNTNVTITRTRNVRNAFYKYLYSGNFVIEHNGRVENGYTDEAIYGLYVMTADGIKVVAGEDELNIKTSLGVVSVRSPEALDVKTSATTVSCDVLAEVRDFLKNTETGAGEQGEFTFIGSGNGHGVGISQHGGRDLAELGKSCAEILETYFPTSEIADRKELTK